MDSLIKNEWNLINIEEYYMLLESLKIPEKVVWTRNIVNTKKECLAIPSKTLKEISKAIFRGNYISFLDIMPNKNHESLIIDAYVISKIKDFKAQTKYILKLAKYIDNWSVVDTLKFNIKNHEDDYFSFARKMASYKLPFYRRIGVRVIFSLIGCDNLLEDVFKYIDAFVLEEDYYVNMALSWLLCELFIKRRKETIDYLSSAHLNNFVLSKFISKCHDSYRVSPSDKLMLSSYKTNYHCYNGG